MSKSIHPLASGLSGAIEFVHSDGTKHRFYSTVNRLSGDRLSAFDGEAPSIGDSVSWVRSVFRDIRAKAEVISVVGDF
jgi:hypothetical protein